MEGSRVQRVRIHDGGTMAQQREQPESSRFDPQVGSKELIENSKALNIDLCYGE